MLLKIEPIFKAVKSLSSYKVHKGKRKIILFSPRGKKFTAALAKKWSKLDQLVLICGRYEGVDERVADHIADDIISVGDFVLNGGEVAAMAVMEAVSRHIRGFMHKEESAIKADFPQYTKPPVFIMKTGKSKVKSLKLKVPKVLLSGNHAKIREWRDKHK